MNPASGPAAGLVVPPLKAAVPPDAAAMYPGTPFLAEGLGLAAMAPDAYAAAIGRAGDCALALAARGAASAFLFGTSLSFFSGPAGNARIVESMTAASGLPSQTLTGALSDALASLGVRRFAAVTAYTAEVNALFRAYFEADGYEIAALEGMGLAALAAVEDVAGADIEALADRALAAAPRVDALVVACAGLRTAAVAPRLEKRLGLPVLSSAMVGAHAAVALSGGQAAVDGFGRFYGS